MSDVRASSVPLWGDKKFFDKPVFVTLAPGSGAKAPGFMTSQSLESFGLSDHVAVYLPQSYNFAGNLLPFPKDQVKPLEADSSGSGPSSLWGPSGEEASGGSKCRL